MKKIIYFCFTLFFLSFLFGSCNKEEQVSKRLNDSISQVSEKEMKPGEIIVRFHSEQTVKSQLGINIKKEKITKKEINAKNELSPLKKFSQYTVNRLIPSGTASLIKKKLKMKKKFLSSSHIVNELYLIKVPDIDAGKTVELIKELNRDPSVDYAAPNNIYKTNEMPDDPYFHLLWGLHNNETNIDIDAPAAWDIQKGTGDVVVAVIDTGVDYTHEDLQANMWVNRDEIPGNGIDDDGNEFIDDIHGIDKVNNDGDPMDDNSHGTHCAGIIGAVGGNGTGVSGVCWNVRIMALKFLNENGSGYSSDAITCLSYAIAKGADIISASWGGGAYNQALIDMIETAKENDILFIAAAGNDGVDTDITPHYPSSYSNDNLISVAALDKTGQLASFSNYGSQSVDIAVPGVSIYSTVPNNQYAYMSGTSMATPYVSGIAALVKSQYPSLTYDQLKTRIFASTLFDENLQNRIFMGGRANARIALTADITPQYSIGGTVTGIEDGSIILINNKMEEITISESGQFGFESLYSRGEPYSVKAVNVSENIYCNVRFYEGFVWDHNIADIKVECENNSGHNLIKNSDAEEGMLYWDVHENGGSVGIIERLRKAFYIQGPEGTFPIMVQDKILLPEGSAGKYLLILGYTWAEDVTTGFITNRPVIWGTQKDDSDNILQYMQSMVHEASEKMWSPIGGIFTIHEDAEYIFLRLSQGQNASLPNNDTKALFDDLEARVFDSIAEAEAWRSDYINDHPEIFEDISYSIDVKVTGLEGSLVLQNNGSDSLSIQSDGTYRFSESMSGGNNYEVTVLSKPDNQRCLVLNGSGIIWENINNVIVSCLDNEVADVNLIKNPGADHGLDYWNSYGITGTMDVHSSVFYIQNNPDQSSRLIQYIDLPDNMDGKFIVITGYTWMENQIGDSITNHPYLYALQYNASGIIVKYMNGMLHNSGEQYWQPIGGVFKIEPGATRVVLLLDQALNYYVPFNNTKACFDEIQLRIYSSEEAALAYYNDYLQSYPIKFGATPPDNMLLNPNAEDGENDWLFSASGDSQAGIIFMSSNAFFIQNDPDYSAVIRQNISLPLDAAGKFLLLIGYGWVENDITGYITNHPYIWGAQKSQSGEYLLYMSGMLHTAPEQTWQTMSSIYPIQEGATNILFQLAQATNAIVKSDNTKACFDNLGAYVFDDYEAAVNFKDLYIQSHREIYMGLE